MSALEAPKSATPGPKIWPLSVNAYHALGEMGLIPEKTELLYGQVFHKMPKSPLHTQLVMQLFELATSQLPHGMHPRQEQPILCGDSEPEPDLAVVRGSRKDYATEHPRTAELVIEVCITSHDYDRSKLLAYAAAGVKECWLVLAPEKLIEVHRQPSGDYFKESLVFGPSGQLASTAVPSFTFDLNAFFPT